MRLTPALLGLAALAGLTHAGVAGGAPPSTALRSQLDTQFDKADRDKDGYLDATELAKVFRGPNAKAIDHPAREPGKASPPETHPDHLFLAEYDRDGDGRVSRAEYAKYEQKVAADAKRAADQQRRLLQQRQRMLRGMQRGRPHR